MFVNGRAGAGSTCTVNRQWPGIMRNFNPPLPRDIDEADLDAIPTLLEIGQQLAATLDWPQILAQAEKLPGDPSGPARAFNPDCDCLRKESRRQMHPSSWNHRLAAVLSTRRTRPADSSVVARLPVRETADRAHTAPSPRAGCRERSGRRGKPRRRPRRRRQ